MSGHRALASAGALGEVDLTVTAHYYLGAVYRGLGAYRQAIELEQQCLTSLHGVQLHERFGLPGLASVLPRSVVVVSLAECGAFIEGRAPAEEGVRLAEAADHPFSRVMAYWGMGLGALRQGEFQEAMSVLERAFTLAQGAHVQLLVPWVAAPLGASYTLARRTADALLLLEQAVEQAVAMRFMLDHALRVVWLGEAYLLAGRLEEASTQAQRALEFSRAHKERGHEAYALRLLGEVTAQSEPPECALAAAHYQQALALAEELGMRPLVAHCHRALGTMYSQMEQREESRAALITALDMYRTMEMSLWLPQTEAALAEVGGAGR